MARGAKAGVSRRTLLATFGISFSGRFPFGNRLSSDRWTDRPLSRVPYCSFHRWSGLLDFCPPGIQRVGGRFKHDIRGSLRRRPECVPGDRLDALMLRRAAFVIASLAFVVTLLTIKTSLLGKPLDNSNGAAQFQDETIIGVTGCCHRICSPVPIL